MTPKSDYIFITPIDKPVTNLIVPQSAQYRSKEFLNGKVTAIGRLVTRTAIGDEVAYQKDSGYEVNKDLIVIKPRHVLAVV